MIGRRIDVLLWSVVVLLAVLATYRWHWYGADRDSPVVLAEATPVRVSFLEDDTLVAAAAATVQRDLFRLERRPSGVPYVVNALAVTAPTEPAAPRPVLSLTGVIGGPPWQGVVNGIPGTEGSVLVQVGSVVNGFTVKAVAESTAVIVGPDTTWTLTLKRGW